EGSAYKNIEIATGYRRRLSSSEIAAGADGRPSGRIFRVSDLCGQGAPKEPTPFTFEGREYTPTKSSHWKPNYPDGLRRIARADRIYPTRKTLNYIRYYDDYPISPLKDVWLDTGHSGFAYDKLYVVQTASAVVERCLLMATDPGDLVLDPTCGSGTTAYVAEQWGRRWITIDTSRVALALARARIMGARYPYYLLADSPEGHKKEGELSGTAPSIGPTRGDIRQGFVYERVPHILLKDIANNAEIDVIWEQYQKELEPLRAKLNNALGKEWEEWEIPRHAGDPWPEKAQKLWDKLERAIAAKKKRLAQKMLDQLNAAMKRDYTLKTLPEGPFDPWNGEEAIRLHKTWWDKRIERQKEIDASIAAKSDFEYLYARPYEDNSKDRVAGPFTVESISPHRVLGVDENDELIDVAAAPAAGYGDEQGFVRMILENLKMAGVQQAHKEDKIDFSSLTPWPGELICAEGRYVEGDDAAGSEKRAGIFIGPEFGTVSRPDLVAAAREAADAGFDVLIACAFNYEAHASEFDRLGRVPVLK